MKPAGIPRWARAIAALGALAFSGVATTARADDDRDARSFVYVMTNPAGPNAVEAYSRDQRTGALTRRGRFPTGGTGDPFVAGFEQHALVADHDTLYAVNPGSDTISAFSIRGDGGLRLLGRVPSGGRRPVSLALTEGVLYVANQGNPPTGLPEQASYSGFRVHRDGRLTPIPGSTVLLNAGDSPADVVFGRNGGVLVGSRLVGNLIDSFVVDGNGRLSRQRTIPGGGGPYGLLAGPANPSILLAALAVPEFFPGEQAPGVASYRVSRNGELQPLDSYTDPDLSDEGLRDPCWLAATPDGRYVWTSSFIPRLLTLFAVDRRGRLTRVSSYNPLDSEDGVVVGSTDIALSRDGRFLYQLRAFSVPDGSTPVVPRVKVLRVTRDWENDAGLREVQEVRLPADLAGSGVMGLVVTGRGRDRD